VEGPVADDRTSSGIPPFLHPVVVGEGACRVGLVCWAVCCGGGPRALPAAGRVTRRGGPAPALGPVQGRSSWTVSCCWGGVTGWCWCGATAHASQSVAACNRGPPSSTSASTSGLSRPVLQILFRNGNLTLTLAGWCRLLWALSGCGGSGWAPGWCGWAVTSLLLRCCGGAVC
jgi:hypothetical protein